MRVAEDVNRFERQLFSRYQNIIDLASPLAKTTGTSGGSKRDAGAADQNAVAERNAAAYNSLRMKMETAAFVKICEEILSTSRQMKEMWLFGKLNTLRDGKGVAGEDEKLEEDAREVGRMMETLLSRNGDGVGITAG